MSDHRIDYSENFYTVVDASSEESSTGSTIPNGTKVAVTRVWLNGAEPTAYVRLVWDNAGTPTVIKSSKGDINEFFDPSNPDFQFTGNGSKKMQIVIDNDNQDATPTIGGGYELTVIS